MAVLARHPFSLAVVAVALAVTGGVFLFVRPQYHAQRGVTIKLPAKQPAQDAPGSAGWVWADGTPGWDPGYSVHGYNVSGLQPVEVAAAQLAAARHGLDSAKVRVLASTRATTSGALAILAAPTLGETPTKTCLAAVLESDEPVSWECPGAAPYRSDLAHSPILVAAARYRFQGLYLVGVARGDVRRVVLDIRGQAPMALYERGTTWGQFDAAVATPSRAALEIYGRDGLLETLALRLRPGQQRVFG